MAQQKLNTTDYYSTSDLALATTLSLFYPLEVIDRTNPNKAQFMFKRDAGLDRTVEAFWRGELKVDPQVYFNQLKITKSRLYAERGNHVD